MDAPHEANRPKRLGKESSVSSIFSESETVDVLSEKGHGEGFAFGPSSTPSDLGVLGPYRILQLLGQGGMGAVFAAIDTRLDRRLALKVMLPRYAENPVAKERFLREARAVAKMTHDNIVTIYEADERNGIPYIAMQLLEGTSLNDHLKTKGNFSLSQVVEIAKQTAAGLHEAHKIGIVHRDIKPGNLWLEAPRGRVKVLDFGLAKPLHAESELTQTGAIIGTPAYMSPEQARGEAVDLQSDLFSLGIVLYRLCTGRLPFEGPNTMAVLMALGTQEPPLVQQYDPNIPDPLAQLIHQLLNKNPQHRPRSAQEVVDRLESISITKETRPTVQKIANRVNVETVSASVSIETRKAGSATPQKSKKGVLVIAGGVLLLLLIGVLGIIQFAKKSPEVSQKVPDPQPLPSQSDPKNTKADPPVLHPPHEDERKAAEWAISNGRAVLINGSTIEIKNPADLPKQPFSLTGLDLNSRQLNPAIVSYLGNCKSLRSLNLRYTEVSNGAIEYLKGCHELEFLDLATTKVGNTGLQYLKDCRKLKHLDLHTTKVEDEGFMALKDCTKFVTLELAYTRITNASLVQFQNYKVLEKLSLENTYVTADGLEHLKGCQSLKYLNVTRNKIPLQSLKEFQKAVPKCRIEYDGGVLEPLSE